MLKDIPTYVPPLKHQNIYVPCKRCGKQMVGLMGYPKGRKTCEPCGGNKTKYNDKNPHPDKRY